mgnify:CR=1 FL=1
MMIQSNNCVPKWCWSSSSPLTLSFCIRFTYHILWNVGMINKGFEQNLNVISLLFQRWWWLVWLSLLYDDHHHSIYEYFRNVFGSNLKNKKNYVWTNENKLKINLYSKFKDNDQKIHSSHIHKHINNCDDIVKCSCHLYPINVDDNTMVTFTMIIYFYLNQI